MFATATPASGSGAARTSTCRTAISTRLAAAAARAASTAAASESSAVTGAKPNVAAATAMTPEPQPRSSEARGRLLQEQLEAEPRRWMGARAERLAGVDHHDERAGVGFFPGRPHPERPDAHWAMETLPRLFPPAGHGTEAPSPSRSRRRASPAASVYAASSSSAWEVDLLEPGGEEGEHGGAGFLRPGELHPHGCAPEPAAQRNAARSFSKKPSSAS